MRDPQKNIGRRFDHDMTANLLLVFEEIDRYKISERRKFRVCCNRSRADTDGEQAAQGPAAQGRPSLSQRQPEAEAMNRRFPPPRSRPRSRTAKALEIVRLTSWPRAKSVGWSFAVRSRRSSTSPRKPTDDSGGPT